MPPELCVSCCNLDHRCRFPWRMILDAVISTTLVIWSHRSSRSQPLVLYRFMQYTVCIRLGSWSCWTPVAAVGKLAWKSCRLLIVKMQKNLYTRSRQRKNCWNRRDGQLTYLTCSSGVSELGLQIDCVVILKEASISSSSADSIC